MLTLTDNEWASLMYDQDSRYVKITWKKMVSSVEYREVNLEVLEQIKKIDVKGYLSDIRKQGVIGPEDAKWMAEVIQPQGVAAGIRKLAVIIDNDIFKKFYASNIQASVVSFGVAELRYFTSEDEAADFVRS